MASRHRGGRCWTLLAAQAVTPAVLSSPSSRAWVIEPWARPEFQEGEVDLEVSVRDVVAQQDATSRDSATAPVGLATPKATSSRWREANDDYMNLAPNVSACAPLGELFEEHHIPIAWNDLLKEDIDDALEEDSVPNLVLALSHGRRGFVDDVILEAIRRHHVSALEKLLEAGVEGVDEVTLGRRPLHEAVQDCMTKGDCAYRMAELLLKHGAKPDACAEDGADVQPPLHNAVYRGCTAVAELLLSYGADPNCARPGGQAPLHVACGLPFSAESGHPAAVTFTQGSTPMLKLLLRYGAHPGMQDGKGFKPSQYSWDPNVQAELWKAERRWERRALANVLARFGFDRPSPSETAVCSPLWRPEIARLVIECL